MISLRQLLDHAAEHRYGVPAFNINNMEQVQAIMQAADETDSPVILQASAGARKYAGEAFLRHITQAAVETWPHIPIVMHQDHGALRQVQFGGCPQQQRSLDTNTATRLLRSLLGCFRRQHGAPAWSDYQILLAESAEMAWIATEGNAFNHATDRVASIDALVEEQSRTGRPLKPTIESSKSGRIRQTAFRADRVTREFLRDDGSRVEHQVPGSFYEFIQRDFVSDPATGGRRLDLAFDSNNAQGIFKMTAAGAHAVPLPAT